MTYTWQEIVRVEGNINNAYKSIEKRKYKKVSHGVYVDGDEFISELEQLFARYPRATLTLQSAFDYYDLSDYVPEKYSLVTPYNSHTITHDKVSQSYMSDDIIDIGRQKIETKYGYIYIFDIERMLIELFRLKVKLPKEYFLEVVSSYRVLKSLGSISFGKIAKYCAKMTKGNKLLKEIQEMI
ncbi:MAG: hypothetical protein MJ227_01605 [Bacilli bacterium]|nr:hypothetical protein [Bacilli bacterium]